MAQNQSLVTTYLGKDGFGRIKTLGQQATYYDAEEAAFCLAFNSKLLSKKVTLIGQLNGSTSFEGQFYVPNDDPKVNWWKLVFGIAIWIAETVDYKKETATTTNSDGTTTTTVTETWSWASPAGPPITTFDGNQFSADHLFLQSKFVYPRGLKPILENAIHEVQIIGRNLGTLTLVNEIYR